MNGRLCQARGRLLYHSLCRADCPGKHGWLQCRVSSEDRLGESPSLTLLRAHAGERAPSAAHFDLRHRPAQAISRGVGGPLPHEAEEGRVGVAAVSAKQQNFWNPEIKCRLSVTSRRPL
jgi:hypothetical protein